MPVDHYWFNGREGSVQQQVATIMAAGVGPDEMLWWDVENEGTMPHWSPAEVVEYATALNAAGIPFARQGVYMSSSVTKLPWGPVVDLGLRLWVANYNTGPCLVHRWRTVHLRQYTSEGRLPGYDGPLDINRAPVDVWTVERLQRALNARGAGLVVDNDYGPATTQAVRVFQETAGLLVDGDAGTRTLTALEQSA